MIDLTPPVRALITSSPSRRDELLDIVRDAMARFVVDDGSVVISNTAIIAWATNEIAG